jgi:flagellar motor component MotA
MAEKMTCLPVIEEILKLSAITSAGGLLALTDYMAEASDFVLQIGLKLIKDGVDPEEVASILDGHIEVQAKSDSDRLRLALVKTGVLGMQNGDKTEYLRDKLYIIMGEDFVQKMVAPTAANTP